MDPFRTRLEQALASQYRFIKELGGGGMSRTYLADEPALQRRVVVKVLAPEMLEGLSVERFKREVLLAASLQHPHVVPVLAAGDADGLPWFSMPYVDGDSLRQRLTRGPVAIDEAVAILRDVARALAYAHSHGIVHRDIKPDNVLLSVGSATVTDFGIAKAISASRQTSSGATLTQAGHAIGTPAYMAPEQAEGALDIDHRADLYAFGAMAFELLTGQPLFAAATPGRLMVAHMTEAPRDPRSLRGDVPAPLADIVLRCLAKLPADRPPDASAIVRALDGNAGMGSGAAIPSAIPSVSLTKVATTWMGGAGLLVGGVFVAARTVGVPSWAMPSAVTLAAAGLPALLGTWWVQRTAQRAVVRTPTLTPGGTMASPGTMATLALKAQPHVTLRRTRRLGVIAASVFAVVLGGFVATRAYGIGPAASLIGSGEFNSRESVLVADFASPANDSTLGVTLSEALRTDLAQSPNLDVVSRATVRDVLQRMQRPSDSHVPFDLAREIATREGTKAVIDGNIVRLGSSYVLAARLVSAVDGRELATFRETAESDAELVPKVGSLSRQIREKVGESLKGLGEARALERVSTPSLAALRKYVEGARLDELGGDQRKVIALLNEAVALDSGFAMAWRKLSAVYSNIPDSRALAIMSIANAYKYRDRLSDNERDLTDAFYYARGPSPDPEKTVAAYEQLLSRDSTNSTALNNLAVYYRESRQYDKALSTLLRATSLARPPASASVQLSYLAGDRQLPLVADSITALYRRHYDGSRQQWNMVVGQLRSRLLLDSLSRLARIWADTSQDATLVAFSGNYLAVFEASKGRITASLASSRARELTLARLTKRDPQSLVMLSDSAVAAARFDGDKARTRGLIAAMLSDDRFMSVPAPQRPWAQATLAAALTSDAEIASALFSAYKRDNSPTAIDRVWSDARVAGQVALARGQYVEAVKQLKGAGSRRTIPNPEEAFLIAVAFDRGGKADSAISWFSRVLDPKDAGEYNAYVYSAGAHKRLAELLDAKGDVDGAIKHYEAFATQWKDAEPSRQPVVKAARERAMQLRTKKNPG